MSREQKLFLAFGRYMHLVETEGRGSPQAVAAYRDWHIAAYGPLPELTSIQPSIPVRPVGEAA